MDDDIPQDAKPNPLSEPIGADLLVPIAACLLTAYYMISTVDLSWESKATGIVVGVCLLAMCGIYFLRTVVKLASGKGRLSFDGLFSATRVNRQRLALIVLTGLFIIIIEWLGTTLGVFILLVASMWVTGVRSLRQLFGVALAVSGTVYVLLIGLLNSRLPRGLPEQLLASLFGGGS